MNQRIWAKSDLIKNQKQSLAEHTKKAINVAEKTVENLPLSYKEREKLKQDSCYALAFHDVGKAAKGFQDVLNGHLTGWGHRHEIISAVFASEIPEITEETLFAILTHHKKIRVNYDQDKKSLPMDVPSKEYIKTKWKTGIFQDWLKNRELFIREWNEICRFIKREDWIKVSSTTNLEKMNLSEDWVVQTQGFPQLEYSYERRRYASLLRAVVVTSDHMASAEVMPDNIPSFKQSKLIEHPVRPFQKKCAETEGHAILWAPTGSGKTEAALLWSQRNWQPKGRLFYILPYTASINAMYKRMQKVFNNEDSNYIGMLHGKASESLYNMMNLEEDVSSKDKQTHAKQRSSLAREICYPIRIATPHQILRYALRGQGWEQMLLEFPNACFIFDEVHAYDPKITGFLLAVVRLVSRWGARCLFMSATLPEFLKELIEKELNQQIEYVSLNNSENEDIEILEQRRHNLEIVQGDIFNHLTDILKVVEKNETALIVCNHVKTAQKLYKMMMNHFGDKVVLLHSRFATKDRNEIENKLTQSLPKLLIATQAVEVSLDVDFDVGFSEPAPIDAIVQRMGRVNREGKKSIVPFTVFSEQVSNHDLYGEIENRIVSKTLIELQKLKNPIREKDLVNTSNIVYKNGYEGEDLVKFKRALNYEELTNFEENLLAGSHKDWLQSVLEDADNKVLVLPKYYEREYKNKTDDGLWIEAQSLLISVYYSSIYHYIEGQEQRLWVTTCEYSPAYGLIIP